MIERAFPVRETMVATWVDTRKYGSHGSRITLRVDDISLVEEVMNPGTGDPHTLLVMGNGERIEIAVPYEEFCTGIGGQQPRPVQPAEPAE